MKEAACEVIEYAFETLKVRTIVANSHNENKRSINLLSKLNSERSVTPDGSTSDFQVFTLSKV